MTQIKRYGLGHKSINVGDGQAVNIPDIVEMADGIYVRYADVQQLIENHGHNQKEGQAVD